MNIKCIKKMNEILDSELWRQPRVFNDGEAAIDLLVMADHDDIVCSTGRRHNIACKRGQVVTTIRQLMDRWNWKIKRTQLFLKNLADMKAISLDSTRDRSIITIDLDDDLCHTAPNDTAEKPAAAPQQGDNKATTNVLDANNLRRTGQQQGDNSTQTASQQGNNKATTNALNANNLRRARRQQGDNSTKTALRKGTPKGTTTVLNVNNLHHTRQQQRANAAAETSTIAPIVYSNEYISIKDESLIDAPYAREDDNSSINDEEEKTPRAGTTKSSRPLSAADYEALAEHYNAAAAHSCLPPLRALTPKRKAMLRARCREYGAEALITAIDKAAASPFLNGDNRRGWRANFDWIFRPNNFIKIIENNYDEKFQKTRADIYRRPSREEEKLRRDQEFAQHLYNKLNNPEPEPELADI